MRSIGAILLFILSLFFIAGSTLAVDISFSEPYLIELDADPYWLPNDIPDGADGITGFKICPGPTYDLILMQNPQARGLLANCVNHSGELIGSAAQYLAGMDIIQTDTAKYLYLASTWADPYYYIFTTMGQMVYYTRLTEGLDLIDEHPVAFIDKPMQFVTDDEFAWIIYRPTGTDYFVNRIRILDGEATFDDILIPSQFASADEIAADKGLWLCDINIAKTTFFPAHVSITGELTIIDSIPNLAEPNYIPTSNCALIPIDSMTAYFCRIERPDSGNYQLQVAGISPDGSPPSASLLLDLDCLPNNRSLNAKGFWKSGTSIVSFIDYNSAVTCLLFEFNLGEIALCAPIPGTVGYTSSRGIEIHDSIALMYNVLNRNVEVGTVNLDDPLMEYQTRQVLYNSSYFLRPTILADSSGILLYNQRSDTESVSIIGCRIDVSNGMPMVTERESVVPIETANRAPWLYDLGDRKMLFWHEYTDRYRGRLAFFENDFPTSAEIDNRIHLYAPNQTEPPAIVRIDSLLYVAQFTYWTYSYYERYLKTNYFLFNLNDYSSLPAPGSLSYPESAGRFAMTAYDNTALISKYLHYCVDLGPASCREYYDGYRGILWNESEANGFTYDEAYTSGDKSTSDQYLDMLSIKAGDEYFIWRENSLLLTKPNPVNHTFDRIVDLRAASGIDFGYTAYHPFTIDIVKLADGYAVFMENNTAPEKSYLLVFDNDWNFKGDAIIPFPASAYDFSQCVYCPQDGRIYFAYSAFLGKPYTALRVFLQSVSIDEVTAVDDGDNTIPRQFSLRQNAPNPFNASTRIQFYLPRQSQVDLTVYNILGQKVNTLIDANLPAGDHEIFWDGADYSGKTVATGIYLYRISTAAGVTTKKMVLLK